MKPMKEENKKKVPKDPKAPVKPPSAFFIYLREQQKKVRKDLEDAQDTGISNNIVAKECGRRWQLLDAATKQKYFEEQKKIQQVYNEELEAYNNSPEKLAENKINKIVNQAKEAEQHIPQMFKDYFSFLEANWTKVAQGMSFASPAEVQETVWKIWSGSRNVAKDKEEESPVVMASRKRVYEEEDCNMDVVHQECEPSGSTVKEEAVTHKSAFEFFTDAIRMETHKSGSRVPDDEIDRLCGERWIYMTEKEKKPFYNQEMKDLEKRKMEAKNLGNKKKSRKRKSNSIVQEPIAVVHVKEEAPDVSSPNSSNNNNISIKHEPDFALAKSSTRCNEVSADGMKMRIGIDSKRGRVRSDDSDSDDNGGLKINEDYSSNSSSSSSSDSESD